MLREITEGWAVDDGRGHLGRGGCELEEGIVVADGDRGNLGIDIEKDVAVKIGDAGVQVSAVLQEALRSVLLVAVALVVVGHHVQAADVEHSS